MKKKTIIIGTIVLGTGIAAAIYFSKKKSAAPATPSGDGTTPGNQPVNVSTVVAAKAAEVQQAVKQINPPMRVTETTQPQIAKTVQDAPVLVASGTVQNKPVVVNTPVQSKAVVSTVAPQPVIAQRIPMVVNTPVQAKPGTAMVMNPRPTNPTVRPAVVTAGRAPVSSGVKSTYIDRNNAVALMGINSSLLN